MFGQAIKEQRMRMGLSLREFCLRTGEDPSNWSKLERGLLRPPADPDRLRQIGDWLQFDDEEFQRLTDLAHAERGTIPGDIMSEEQLVGKLPAIFRTIRNELPDTEKLRRLAEQIREVHRPE